MAHPLHPYRFAERDGNQSGICGGVFMPVTAIATGAFHIDQAHVGGFQRQHGGDLVARQVRRLGR